MEFKLDDRVEYIGSVWPHMQGERGTIVSSNSMMSSVIFNLYKKKSCFNKSLRLVCDMNRNGANSCK